MFSLGIGRNVDRTQLNDIASSNNNVFTAASFAELEPVAKTIVQSSCPGGFSLKLSKLSKISILARTTNCLVCRTIRLKPRLIRL